MKKNGLSDESNRIISEWVEDVVMNGIYPLEEIILMDDPSSPITQRQLDAMTYWSKPENKFFGKGLNEILDSTEVVNSRACFSGDETK